MLKLFSRKKKSQIDERAPQLTAYERMALEVPGVPPADLPYAVYDAMEKDSMVQTCLTLKKLAVLAAGYRIEPGDDTPEAKERAAFVEKCFIDMDESPNSVLYAAMDAFSKGWSVQELVYEPTAEGVKLRAIRSKNPALFGLETDAFGNATSLRLQLPGEDPQELARSKFVIYRHRPSYARIKGRSDFDAAYPHWVAKQSLLAAWKFHLERFAMPTVLGKFARGLPASEQSTILEALKRLQDNVAIVHPNEIEITTLGGNRDASTGFQEAIEFHNREIARAIVGQTLTTDEGRRVGSLALGKVHLQVLMLQMNAIRRELADLVMTEQVIRPLIEMNFGPGPMPRFVFDETPVDAFTTGRI